MKTSPCKLWDNVLPLALSDNVGMATVNVLSCSHGDVMREELTKLHHHVAGGAVGAPVLPLHIVGVSWLMMESSADDSGTWQLRS